MLADTLLDDLKAVELVLDGFENRGCAFLFGWCNALAHILLFAILLFHRLAFDAAHACCNRLFVGCPPSGIGVNDIVSGVDNAVNKICRLLVSVNANQIFAVSCGKHIRRVEY